MADILIGYLPRQSELEAEDRGIRERELSGKVLGWPFIESATDCLKLGASDFL